MSEGQMLKNMPTEVIMNIQSFLLGEPRSLKIKHNPTLKVIHNKYKIYYTDPQIGYKIYTSQTETLIIITWRWKSLTAYDKHIKKCK